MPIVKKDDKSCILLRLDGERDSCFPNMDHNDPLYGLCSACKESESALQGTPLICISSLERGAMENAQNKKISCFLLLTNDHGKDPLCLYVMQNPCEIIGQDRIEK